MPQVPLLLRRIQFLLNVYYDVNLGQSNSSQESFIYCDSPNLEEYAFELRFLGTVLFRRRGVLLYLMYFAPDMRTFLFDEEVKLPECYANTAQLYDDIRHRRAPHCHYIDLDDVVASIRTSNVHAAAADMMNFIAPILLAHILWTLPDLVDDPDFETNSMWEALSWQTLRKHTTSFASMKAFGLELYLTFFLDMIQFNRTHLFSKRGLVELISVAVCKQTCFYVAVTFNC